MAANWEELTFIPSEEAIRELLDAWGWLLPEMFQPVLASAFGDVFFHQGGPEIYWLSTSTAGITRVAASSEEFFKSLRTERSDEWLLPDHVEQLRGAGKELREDYCYSNVILPVFKEYKSEVWNFNPVPAREHFGITGEIHRQCKDLPQGKKVRIKFV